MLFSYFVYIIFIPLIFFSLYKVKGGYWKYPIVVILLYSILMGIRYKVGFDWEQYADNFRFFSKSINLVTRDYEIGYVAINLLLAKILNFHYCSLFILESFLYLYSMYLLARVVNNRNIAALGCTLFYCISFFHGVNLSREYLGLSICIIGLYMLLRQKNNILSYAIMLIGCSMHSALYIPVFICVVAYYYQPKLSFKCMVIIYALLFVLFHVLFERFVSDIYSSITLLSSLFADERLSIYVNRDFLSSDSIHFMHYSFVRLLIYFTRDIVILYLICRLYNKNSSKNIRMILLCGTMSVLFSTPFINNELLMRFIYLFEPFFALTLAYLSFTKLDNRMDNLACNIARFISLFWIYMFITGVEYKISTHGIYYLYKTIPNLNIF